MPTETVARSGFRVEIDGLAPDEFLSVEMLETSTAVIEYRTGGESVVHKLPGLHSYGDIVLTRGWTGDLALWQWRRTVLAGQADRRAGSIVVLDAARVEVSRINFFDGWPRRWRLGPWRGTADEPLVETIDLAVERIDFA